MPKKKRPSFPFGAEHLLYPDDLPEQKGQLLAGNFLNNILNASHSLTKSVVDSIKSPFTRMALRDEDNALLRKRVDELLLERARYQKLSLKIND